MKNNSFAKFIDNVEKFPVWLKQVLLMKLSDNLKNEVCEKFLKENSCDILSFYKPVLTHSGLNELDEKKCGFDLNIYNFLGYCKENCSILEISLNTFLSLEEVAKYFLFCLEQNLIEKPKNIEIEAMAGFIAGKFKTGEYFAINGKITNSQLEKAVEVSKNNDKKFAQILVDLGFVTQDDVSAMLAFKLNSKERIVLDYNNVPKTETLFCSKEDEYLKIIEDLKLENAQLKKKLAQLLDIVKNYD